MYVQDHQINRSSKEGFLFSQPGHSEVRGSLRTRNSALYNSLWACTSRLNIGRSHRAMALTAPSRPTCSSRSRGPTSAGVSRTTTASARTSGHRSRRSWPWLLPCLYLCLCLGLGYASAFSFPSCAAIIPAFASSVLTLRQARFESSGTSLFLPMLPKL